MHKLIRQRFKTKVQLGLILGGFLEVFCLILTASSAYAAAGEISNYNITMQDDGCSRTIVGAGTNMIGDDSGYLGSDICIRTISYDDFKKEDNMLTVEVPTELVDQETEQLILDENGQKMYAEGTQEMPIWQYVKARLANGGCEDYYSENERLECIYNQENHVEGFGAKVDDISETAICSSLKGMPINGLIKEINPGNNPDEKQEVAMLYNTWYLQNSIRCASLRRNQEGKRYTARFYLPASNLYFVSSGTHATDWSIVQKDYDEIYKKAYLEQYIEDYPKQYLEQYFRNKYGDELYENGREREYISAIDDWRSIPRIKPYVDESSNFECTYDDALVGKEMSLGMFKREAQTVIIDCYESETSESKTRLDNRILYIENDVLRLSNNDKLKYGVEYSLKVNNESNVDYEKPELTEKNGEYYSDNYKEKYKENAGIIYEKKYKNTIQEDLGSKIDELAQALEDGQKKEPGDCLTSYNGCEYFQEWYTEKNYEWVTLSDWNKLTDEKKNEYRDSLKEYIETKAKKEATKAATEEFNNGKEMAEFNKEINEGVRNGITLEAYGTIKSIDEIMKEQAAQSAKEATRQKAAETADTVAEGSEAGQLRREVMPTDKARHAIKLYGVLEIHGQGDSRGDKTTSLIPYGGNMDMFVFDNYSVLAENDKGYSVLSQLNERDDTILRGAKFESFLIDGSNLTGRVEGEHSAGFYINLFQNCSWNMVTVQNMGAAGYALSIPTKTNTINDSRAYGNARSGFSISNGYPNKVEINLEGETEFDITKSAAIGNSTYGFFVGKKTDDVYSGFAGTTTIQNNVAASNEFNYGGKNARNIQFLDNLSFTNLNDLNGTGAVASRVEGVLNGTIGSPNGEELLEQTAKNSISNIGCYIGTNNGTVCSRRNTYFDGGSENLRFGENQQQRRGIDVARSAFVDGNNSGDNKYAQAYYHDALIFAEENGMIYGGYTWAGSSGISDIAGRYFGLEKNVTLRDALSLIWRMQGFSGNTGGGSNCFTDGGLSSLSVWAWNQGIIKPEVKPEPDKNIEGDICGKSQGRLFNNGQNPENIILSRADFMLLLYNFLNGGLASKAGQRYIVFSDVHEFQNDPWGSLSANAYDNGWYSAVRWSNMNYLSNGAVKIDPNDENIFKPAEKITLEQVLTILYRYWANYQCQAYGDNGWCPDMEWLLKIEHNEGSIDG